MLHVPATRFAQANHPHLASYLPVAGQLHFTLPETYLAEVPWLAHKRVLVLRRRVLLAVIAGGTLVVELRREGGARTAHVALGTSGGLQNKQWRSLRKHVCVCGAGACVRLLVILASASACVSSGKNLRVCSRFYYRVMIHLLHYFTCARFAICCVPHTRPGGQGSHWEMSVMPGRADQVPCVCVCVCARARVCACAFARGLLYVPHT